jgi:putative ATPase
MANLKYQHQTESGQTIGLYQGDLTLENVDAIVNAANSHLAHGGGVAAAIARRGGPVIDDESDQWVEEHGPVPVGGVALTRGGDLPARYVIHAVGPRWGVDTPEEELLRNAVWNSLKMAQEQGFASIALPAISSGIFGFPKDRCAQILVQTALDFCAQEPASSVRDIRFIVYDDPTTAVFEAEFRRQLGN